MTNVSSMSSPRGESERGRAGRLLSLDILRGLTVAGMIFVNNGYGESFEMFHHVKWNGMTPCDLVFPFFLFIMGVSTYLSLSKFQFKATAPVITKIIKRTVILFLLGLFINWFDHAVEGDVLCFDHLRIWAVLQRIALCYCGVSLFAVLCNHKYLVHTIITLLVIYSGILIIGNGYAEDAATNILAQVDLNLFGYDHLYHKSPVDPEGLLGTISGIAHVMIGFYCGKKMKEAPTVNDKLTRFLLVGAVLVISGYLLSFALPLNKRIWSPSYVMMSCGLASLLLGILMYVIDVKKQQKWTPFFHVFGVNALVLYASSEFMAILFGRFGINDWIYSLYSYGILDPRISSVFYAMTFVLLNFVIGYPLYKNKVYIKL